MNGFARGKRARKARMNKPAIALCCPRDFLAPQRATRRLRVVPHLSHAQTIAASPLSCVASRREFLQHAGLALATLAAAGSRPLAAAASPARPLFTRVGIAAAPERAAEMKALGADYLVPPTADFLMPDAAVEAFEAQLQQVAASGLPILACNIFLRHPRLRSTGPDANHAAVLAFAEIAFQRLARAGGRFMVFGSSGSRQLPDGWPKERADKQFQTLLRAMGPIAARHGIVVAVEQLRAAECNYLNHLREVVRIVGAVDHPNVRVLADLYHMAVMGDTPADLDAAMPLVGLVEIAEKENRAMPGVAGDDFRPFFAVLARHAYSGPITVEGNGTPEEIRGAFPTIRRQATEVTGSATV
jgi:sugar phosphate isomerase/epimerase